MALAIRPIMAEDAERAGQICHEAFSAIADRHNFPSDFPDPRGAIDLIAWLAVHPGIYGIVAERDGVVVGSNFIDERGAIVGLGPITVEPGAQNAGVGTALMTHMIDRAARNRAAGLRLLQSAYHARSLCLYTKLGFAVREPLVNLQGRPPGVAIAGVHVRPATETDAASCNRLCRYVHGHDRAGELDDAIEQQTATIVERDGRITGYTTRIAFFGHAVAESNDDLKALIAAAAFPERGFLLPSRNTELFVWCLGHGLRMVQPMTLMTIGLYNEPKGAWLPSILY
jgi:GNAT superfamily N-acetyltransferase